MNWTDAQKKAIEIRNKNILVSASAGSGKTAVLSERVLSLINEGADIDKFLIFTFTKASAKEMKTRIYKKILKEYKKTNDPHLKKQLEKINSANISTIHAFCMSVVKESFYLLDMPPRFNICNEVDEALIDAVVIHDILEENYRDKTDNFQLASDFFDGNLEQVVMALARHLAQQIDIDKYVEDVYHYYQDEGKIRATLEAHVSSESEKILDTINHLMNIAKDNKKLVETLKLDKDVVLSMPCAQATFCRLSSDGKLDEEAKRVKEIVSKARNEYKPIIDELNKLDIDLEVAEHTKNIAVVSELARLAKEFLERSFKTRLEKGLLSFNDLEALTKKALEEEEVAKIYQNRFDYIFVDEYQDTSDIQENIIQRISRDNNLFMVGDIKQSIYSFRQANPNIFIDKYNSFKESKLSERIDLNSNFRSSKFVLDVVNEIFDELMTIEHGGLDYKHDARLEFGNQSLSHLKDKPRIVFVKKNNASAIRREYEYIASEVKKLVASGKKYSDIVVLSRSLKSSVVDASEVFRANGIPFYFDYSESYLDSLEVDIMLNYLRLINNFRNDLAFLSLVRLPRYDFTDNEIYQVRKSDTDRPIYDTFLSYNTEDEIKEKIDFFLNDIKRFRRLEYEKSLDELIQFIYKETDFEKYVYLLDKPKQRLANIRLLFSIASEYESSTMVGLSNFLKFIEGIKKNKKDFSGANIIGDKNDVLRIMSIHKSKGLEFDTVFLANCEKKFNELDFRSSFIFKDRYIELDYIDVANRVKRKSFVKKLVLQSLRKHMHEEELRLLYVALTRAVNKLFIVSAIESEEDIFQYEPSDANSYFKYISLMFSRESVDTEVVDDIEIIEDNKKFSYTLKTIDIPEIAFDATIKATKKSVTSIIHGASSTTINKDLLNNEAMKKGSEFHKIMEWIRFEDDVETEFDRLIDVGIISNKDSMDLVNKLFSSKLYQMIKDSVKIERELEFIYRQDEFIQGIIDLVIHTKDGVIIVDYKTDKSLLGLEDYKRQLGYYSKAYEKVRKEKVIGKYLYFVRLDNLYKID